MESSPTVEDVAGGDAGSATGSACDDAPKTCDSALARAFQFLGKRWNGVLLGTLTNGDSGFAELKRNVGGISDSVLSERLSELQAAGLIVRSVEPGPPVAVTYHLSATGQALIPAMDALSRWATQYFPEADTATPTP